MRHTPAEVVEHDLLRPLRGLLSRWRVGCFRDPSAVGPRVLAVATVVVVALAIVAGCATGNAPAQPAGSVAPSSSCTWQAPPPDPAVAATQCGAGPEMVAAPLGHGADLLPVTIALYTDHPLNCPPGTASCAVQDNRAVLPAGAPAPPIIDPSRSRATITLNWQDHQAILRLSPHCHVPRPAPGSASGPLPETCATPAASTFQATTTPDPRAPWRFDLQLTLPGDPTDTPIATVHDQWDIALDPTTGDLDLTGEGTNTPAFALITVGTVACSDPGSPPPPLATPAMQHYFCHTRIPPNP